MTPPAPLGVAVAGCGRMGRRHVLAAQASPLVALRAVCDPVPGVAASVAPAGVAACETLDDVLGRDDVDAVVVAAPSALHESLVDACLDAGRHVLCEKPLTFDTAADARLGERAARAGLVLQVGFWRRVAWPYLAAHALLDAGTIGEPRLLRACQWDAEPPPPAFCDPAVSGGIEVDCGVHELDLAAFLLGSPVVAVAAAGAPTRPDIAAVGDVEAAAAIARTAAGHAVTVDLARGAGYADDVRSELVGEHGALLVRADGPGELLVGTARGLRPHGDPVADVLADALVRQLERFAAGAAAGVLAAGVAGATQSAHALAGAQAMRRSRLSGRWEDVAPGWACA